MSADETKNDETKDTGETQHTGTQHTDAPKDRAGHVGGPDILAQPGILTDLLGISVLEASGVRVVATMPVERRVHQPFGLLHGGASVVLAESVASIGAYLNVRDRGMVAVGLEINANHLRGVSSGLLTATATPVFQGRSTEVWQIEILDERHKAVCVSRCTLAIIPAPAPGGTAAHPESPPGS